MHLKVFRNRLLKWDGKTRRSLKRRERLLAMQFGAKEEILGVPLAQGRLLILVDAKVHRLKAMRMDESDRAL